MEMGSIADWLAFVVALVGLLLFIILEWEKLTKRFSRGREWLQNRQVPETAARFVVIFIGVVTGAAYFVVAMAIFGFILTTMREMNFPPLIQGCGLLLGGSLIVYAIVEIIDRFI